MSVYAEMITEAAVKGSSKRGAIAVKVGKKFVWYLDGKRISASKARSALAAIDAVMPQEKKL